MRFPLWKDILMRKLIIAAAAAFAFAGLAACGESATRPSPANVS